MRKIYKYDEQAKKYLSAIIKRKMPDAKPWLHVGVKTLSNRSPWSAIVIWVWDTRQVIFEHRFQRGGPTNEQMLVQNSHMQLANDNRQPLVGGRNDINELMELGPDFDASHGKVFDGKNRIAGGNIWKKKTKLAKPSTESIVDASEIDVIATETAPDWSPSPEYKQAVANALRMYKKACTFLTNTEKQLDALEKDAHDVRQTIGSNVKRMIVGKDIRNYAIDMYVSANTTIDELFDRLNDKLEALKRSFRN